MGASIGFYCGPSDIRALQDLSVSLGLHLVAPTIDAKGVPSPEDGPYCFLSVVTKDSLHPYGRPKVRVTDARDPLMRFVRAYYKDPYLVAGHVYWSNDVRSLADQTKPYFEKIRTWIRGNWEKLPEGDFYVGPEASRLISGGAKMVNVLPSTVGVDIIKI